MVLEHYFKFIKDLLSLYLGVLVIMFSCSYICTLRQLGIFKSYLGVRWSGGFTLLILIENFEEGLEIHES